MPTYLHLPRGLASSPCVSEPAREFILGTYLPHASSVVLPWIVDLIKMCPCLGTEEGPIFWSTRSPVREYARNRKAHLARAASFARLVVETLGDIDVGNVVLRHLEMSANSGISGN